MPTDKFSPADVMSVRPGAARKSYLKTTLACLALALLTLLIALASFYWLPRIVGLVVAVPCALLAIASTFLACGGAVVLTRYKRDSLGRPDIFLTLNRSRDAAAIKAAPTKHASRARRWLATQLLGHDLIVGDLVEVKSWTEISATLDERGCLEQLPFMPEMLAMCGRRARIFRSAHRIFDYRKTRRMRHMNDAVLLVETMCDGSGHGGCDAACHTIWKSAWLRRVEPNVDATNSGPGSSNRSAAQTGHAALQFGTQAPRYSCQLTELNAASQPVGNWSATNFLRPLVSGNVAPMAFVVGWLTFLFDELQHQRQGIGFPEFEIPAEGVEKPGDTRLAPGDQVIVRSPTAIRATLTDDLTHRGMGFEVDMLKHCGRRHFVQAEVRKLIDIVSGEMRTMKTPAYILRDVHFSGERQLFNAQYEPLFWRGAWLHRDGGSTLTLGHGESSENRASGEPLSSMK